MNSVTRNIFIAILVHTLTHSAQAGEIAPTVLPPARSTVIVALGSSKEVTERALTRAKREGELGAPALSQVQVTRVLTGGDALRLPEISALKAMLVDSAEHEAQFDSIGAEALRVEILRAYSEALRPSEDLVEIAAETLHGRVAALLPTGARTGALAAAKQAVRRFPQHAVDSRRHPPDVVALFERARAQIREGRHGFLRVRLSPGEKIWVDGNRDNRVSGKGATPEPGGVTKIRLPVGHYKVWLVGTGASSLPRHVDVSEGSVRMNATEDTGDVLEFDLDLESCLQVTPVLALACSEKWPEHLLRLGARLGATRVIAMGASGMDLSQVVGLESEVGRIPTIIVDPGVAQSTEAHSGALRIPLAFVPFGIPQAVQGRLWAAAVIATAQLGLGVWHWHALDAHNELVTSGALEGEPKLRRERNLSAALLYGALVGGIADALLHAWISTD